MDLNESQANELFPADRGDGVVGDFHLGIDFGSDSHVVIYTDDERFVLSEQEKEEMLEQCDLESVWYALTHRLKVLRYLRTSEL